MATAGTLSVDLTLDATPFNTGIQTAQKTLGQFRKAGSWAGETIMSGFTAPLVAAATTALTVGTAVQKFNEQIEEVDRITQTAGRLGIATDKFVGLEHAIGQVSQVTSDQFTTSLQTMNKQLALADQGGGSALKAFQKLGLNARQLKALKPDEAFLKIADAFASINNVSDETQLAMAIFGKSGAGLLPVLDQGSESLQRFQEQARLLGITFDGEAGSSVADFKDAQDRLKASLDANWRVLAVNLSPALIEVSDHLTATTVAVRHGVIAWGEYAKSLTAAGGSLEAIGHLFGQVASVFETLLPDSVSGWLRTANEGYSAIHQTVQGFDAAAQSASDYADALERLKAPGAATFGTVGGFSAVQEGMFANSRYYGVGEMSGGTAAVTAAVSTVADKSEKILEVEKAVLAEFKVLNRETKKQTPTEKIGLRRVLYLDE